MKRAAALLILSGFLAAPAAPAAQAKALPGPQESYLFTVDSPWMTVKPGKGDAAKVVVTAPDAIRWSDRPYRHQLDMTIAEMLGEFRWDAHTHKLAPATPNASVSIGGHSQIVDIRKATKHDGRLVLSVRGIHGAVASAAGPGSIMIDNTVTYPVGSKTPVDGIDYTLFNVMADTPEEVYVDIEYNNGVMAHGILTPENPTADERWYLNTTNYQTWWDVHFAAEFSDTGLDVTATFTYGPPNADNPATVIAYRHYER